MKDLALRNLVVMKDQRSLESLRMIMFWKDDAGVYIDKEPSLEAKASRKSPLNVVFSKS